jgi:DNA-directed RNA polymerase subunit RPC12/RpoP
MSLLSDRGCARCGKRVPDLASAFGPFTHVSGLPFGRCQKCDKIWCYDCAEKDEDGNLVYYECPQCHAELKSRL